jgi:hypothetical protein
MNAIPEPRCGGAAVDALLADITRLGLVVRSAEPGDDICDVVDELENAITWLARSESDDLEGLRGKLVVLRQRLEEMLDPEVAGEALTLALVASALRDVERFGR